MKFEFEIIIGNQKVTVTEEASDHAAFIEKLSFFSGIPTKGPKGSTNLRFLHKRVKGFDYYSIMDDDDKMEFKFGQSKECPGKLFGKGWQPAYRKDEDSDDNFDSEEEYEVAKPAPMAAFSKIKSPVTPAAKAPTPKAPTAPAAPAPQASANSSAINDVLAKYGIKK